MLHIFFRKTGRINSALSTTEVVHQNDSIKLGKYFGVAVYSRFLHITILSNAAVAGGEIAENKDRNVLLATDNHKFSAIVRQMGSAGERCVPFS